MSENKLTHFEVLNGINVGEKVEKKDNLNYLSWTYAWSEVKKKYPDAKYDIIRDPKTGLPYFFDENTGYMVFTWVEIEGIRHDMWLPVMDGKNKAMKSKSYNYKTKYAEKTVEACSMFDINKTIMRCLTKNLAMFGLGLYIYSGEDLPEDEKFNIQWSSIKVKSEDSKQICKWFRDKYEKNLDNALQGLKAYGIKHFNDLDSEENKVKVSLIKQMMAIGNK